MNQPRNPVAIRTTAIAMGTTTHTITIMVTAAAWAAIRTFRFPPKA